MYLQEQRPCNVKMQQASRTAKKDVVILFFPNPTPGDGTQARVPYSLLNLERALGNLGVEVVLLDEQLQPDYLERPLGELRLCAVLIDGTPFRDRQMIVALGISTDGRKTVLGLREGASENASVVSELLSDLAARGLDFSVPRLYVLDDGKALAATLRRHAGAAA
jgi:hypothetical protein